MLALGKASVGQSEQMDAILHLCLYLRFLAQISEMSEATLDAVLSTVQSLKSVSPRMSFVWCDDADRPTQKLAEHRAECEQLRQLQAMREDRAKQFEESKKKNHMEQFRRRLQRQRRTRRSSAGGCRGKGGRGASSSDWRPAFDLRLLLFVVLTSPISIHLCILRGEALLPAVYATWSRPSNARENRRSSLLGSLSA